MIRGIGKPNPGVVVGTIALVLALAGTAVAVGVNSIGADELGKVVQRSKEKTVPAGDNAAARARCQRDEQLLGGGATLPGADPAERPSVEQNGPTSKRTWFALGNNDDSLIDATLEVTAICLKK